MDFKAIEKKWQQKWKADKRLFFDPQSKSEKYYALEMFSYPSGYNLHIGHCYNFAPADSVARLKKMQGYNVFHPMGFDAFGLPSENFAIKTGVHPKDSTLKNVAVMVDQLNAIGALYDWDYTLTTCYPEYYKWTQWLFLQLYKSGLAYQKESPVNWCTSCNTVIANEQVVDGSCERCHSPVIKKSMTQWFFKITDYAEELLSTVDALDWPEKTKLMQKNWIGRSVGGEIVFDLAGYDSKITVFTTRADTLMGVSAVVLAPEHPLVGKITTKACFDGVEAYKNDTARKDDVDRLSDKSEKTGQFTGAYCIHPIDGRKIPVWIADYCLYTYGTGAVMVVPAHDTRDYDFAKKFGLDIIKVIKPDSPDSSEEDGAFTADGLLINSGKFNGLTSLQAREKITDELQKNDMGRKKINYRLRDWSVSRQRYWGSPIPIIHCEKCGAVPVREKDLPVTLPYNVNFTPDGKSPLGKCKEYIDATCPKCGAAAKRDPDTLDTFVCSSWYFLRYPDANNALNAFDTVTVNKMLPVDKYVGGAEHACMHLLYARFITKALRDMGYLKFSEPFTSLVHQGMILGADGEKISKSRGNVVNPDYYLAEYGADMLRLQMMFGFSYIDGGAWNDDGFKAISRFLDRIERITERAVARKNDISSAKTTAANQSEAEDELLYATHYCIKSMTEDIAKFSFNTAIARAMEMVNAMYKYEDCVSADVFFAAVQTLIKLLAPLAPHFCEELHEKSGGKDSIFLSDYPVCDQSKLIRDSIEIAVQVNSKIRGRITIGTGFTDEQITAAALAEEKVKEFTNGLAVKKVIIIKSKLVNIIV